MLLRWILFIRRYFALKSFFFLNFEGLEMKKSNITIDKAQRVDKKRGCLCSYHAYSRSYGH